MRFLLGNLSILLMGAKCGWLGSGGLVYCSISYNDHRYLKLVSKNMVVTDCRTAKDV